jgi:hypothetical protein
MLFLGTSSLAMSCEQRPIPPTTSASATVALALPSAAPTLTLNPEYVKARDNEYTAPRHCVLCMPRVSDRATFHQDAPRSTALRVRNAERERQHQVKLWSISFH